MNISSHEHVLVQTAPPPETVLCCIHCWGCGAAESGSLGLSAAQLELSCPQMFECQDGAEQQEGRGAVCV